VLAASIHWICSGREARDRADPERNGVDPPAGEPASLRAKVLTDQLRMTAAELIAVIERIESERWDRVRKPCGWSPGKDGAGADSRERVRAVDVCRESLVLPNRKKLNLSVQR
jgi:hypothetical protein